MEFMTGVNKKETLEIGDLLTGSYEGKSVKVCLRRRKNTV